jgi:hypothetical protein
MGSIGKVIQSTYVSLLSDISSNPSSQAPASIVDPIDFKQALAKATTADSPSQTASSPHTLQVEFDTNPGALYGRPIAPGGSASVGDWTVLADGSYFSASDVDASGLATLHAPPTGWQETPAGETLTSPAGIANNASSGATTSSTGTGGTGTPGGEDSPVTLQVQFDTNPGPFFGRPIAPEGSSTVGDWTVLADGSYFSVNDVSPSGLVTLHAPPDGWQDMPTGQTLTSPAGLG